MPEPRYIPKCERDVDNHPSLNKFDNNTPEYFHMQTSSWNVSGDDKKCVNIPNSSFHSQHGRNIQNSQVETRNYETTGKYLGNSSSTLKYEQGDQLHELAQLGYSQEIRNQLGVSLFKIMAKQLFDLQHLHADPNPANFAFRKNGQIILYDFGCTKLLNAPLVEAYRKTILAGLNEDYPAVEEGLIRCGARNLDGPAVEHEYYKMWRDIFMEPFHPGSEYDFGKTEIHGLLIE